MFDFLTKMVFAHCDEQCYLLEDKAVIVLIVLYLIYFLVPQPSTGDGSTAVGV